MSFLAYIGATVAGAAVSNERDNSQISSMQLLDGNHNQPSHFDAYFSVLEAICHGTNSKLVF